MIMSTVHKDYRKVGTPYIIYTLVSADNPTQSTSLIQLMIWTFFTILKQERVLDMKDQNALKIYSEETLRGG